MSFRNIIIDNFYARLSFQDKTLLDTTCSGSFTSNKEEFKRDLLDRIKENAEDWENDKGYADKPPFKPLPPKEGREEREEEKKKKKKGTKKKKKKKENKKKEVTAYPRVNEITLGNRKYVAPNDYCDNESEYDDLPMPFTYISDHDLNEHTTFDITNLWETNSENDNNCHSVSAIHASSHNDIESSKLGEEVFENPFATGHYVLDTSPSNNNDDARPEGPLSAEEQEKFEKVDAMFKAALFSILGDNIVDPYMAFDHGKDAWDALEAKFGVSDAGTEWYVMEQYYDYRMTDERSVVEQAHEIQSLAKELEQFKCTLPDKFVPVALLPSFLLRGGTLLLL
ncbi:hypothetical protein QYE76_001588 [Lolium multiflorum]|uniref:Uncharacterized protein n=1 Tax=Lolium multiflorum TaxID=4521 RepID=A0AAD8VZH9_LOLMU|nr:hypothetical protein QYE76_001588 [Lolium multiflorum]